jgi:hypothetical protein
MIAISKEDRSVLKLTGEGLLTGMIMLFPASSCKNCMLPYGIGEKSMHEYFHWTCEF